MSMVCKFGGSSVADYRQFIKVKNIVTSNKNRKIIVVSALGKSSEYSFKVTDLLILTDKLIKGNFNYKGVLKLIFDRYNGIKKALNLKINLKKEYKTILEKIKNNYESDYLISRGEYLCAKLMAKYLGFQFVDSSKIIYFDLSGNVDMKKSKLNFNKLRLKNKKMVVSGFYGSDINGKIKTFSRGGSDLSGAVLSVLANVKTYENWTDIDGVKVVNPIYYKNAKTIKKISYFHIKSLCDSGVEVLHNDCVKILKNHFVTILVKNTFNPKGDYTVIKQNIFDNELIKGLSVKKDFLLLENVKDIINLLNMLDNNSIMYHNINNNIIIHISDYEKSLLCRKRYDIKLLSCVSVIINSNAINFQINISILLKMLESYAKAYQLNDNIFKIYIEDKYVNLVIEKILSKDWSADEIRDNK